MEEGSWQAVDEAGARDDEEQGAQRVDSQSAEDHHQQTRSDENHRFPAEAPYVPEKRNDVRAVPLWKQSSMSIFKLYQILCNMQCTIFNLEIYNIN